MEPWVSEEFFDKYAWNFLKYVHWFSIYIYIHTFACLASKRPATREPGKVEKEVLAIPSRAEYGYGHTDNSFRVPDSSMCDLWFIWG
jgi:hypothetical protein